MIIISENVVHNERLKHLVDGNGRLHDPSSSLPALHFCFNKKKQLQFIYENKIKRVIYQKLLLGFFNKRYIIIKRTNNKMYIIFF